MKLYYKKGACSLVVRIVIHELGLPCDYEAVDLKTKVTETGVDFLTINPKGAVPTLITDDGKVLTENAVIQQYLVDTHHASTLLPPVGDFNRYRVLEWLNFITTDIHKGFGPLFDPQIPDTIKKDVVIPTLQRKFSIANQALENNAFLTGDHFTLPDAYLFVMLTWAHQIKIYLSDLTHLTRFFDELEQRKTIVDARAEEILFTSKT
ncbi:MAG: glutathione transferase GstA [Pseudomonadota bacterium]|nr:glutathione transferase GstA [Pseudomonadota bacterium]